MTTNIYNDFIGRNGNFNYKKKSEFLLSKISNFTVPHFYIIWKLLKNPIVGRPIVAGYNWILTPASIFVGHYLKECYVKFDSIFTDSLSLIKLLETSRFNEGCFFIYDRFSKFTYTYPSRSCNKCIIK